jgi:hypothetical protein
MSQTYLQLCNRVLRRFNEVQLQSTTFTSASGFQQQVQDAINDALNDIYAAEINWPFLYQTTTFVTTAGQQFYSLASNATQIDWQSFLIQRDDTQSPPVISNYIKFLDYYEWLQTRAGTEQQMLADDWSPPLNVVRHVNNTQLILSPPPGPGINGSQLTNVIYHINYNNWIFPTDLVNATDTTVVPDRFKGVIIDGGMYYGYMFRDNPDEAAIAQSKFEKGIARMRTELINRADYMRSDNIVQDTIGYV